MQNSFFDEATDLFWIFDKDHNLVDINEAALRLFHWKKNEMIGKNITEISPDVTSSGRLAIHKEVMRTGKTVVLDDIAPHPSLGKFYFRVKIFKLNDGLGIITTNVTDLKETISELETFIYKSSHDMRAPIASILGLLNLAGSNLKDIETAKQYCNIVGRETGKLDNILKKLIDTVRIRQGDKIIHLIDFEQLLDDVLNSLAYVKGFNAVKINRTISVNKKFYSDKLLLTSIFQNLIDNAVKYKKENAEDCFINIKVSLENGGIIITIRDNGIGIAEHSQKDIFNMFFRATTQASGTGLGLYTVHHCIKKLNGHIKLDSAMDIGTTFTVYLPNAKNGENEY